MAELAAFQLAFAAAILRRGTRRDRLESQPGFAVYRNTTPNALSEALAAHYPVSREIVGEPAFAALAFAYSRRHPPSGPVLLEYGERFADFIETQNWASEMPYLADVARIERLYGETHRARDAAPMDLADVAALGLERCLALRLPLHPATRAAWLGTPAMTIWKAHRLPGGFDRLEPEWRAEGVLFTRPRSEVRTAPIDAPTHRLIVRLRVGDSLGEAAAGVARLHTDADVPRLFTHLVASGAFSRPPQLERK